MIEKRESRPCTDTLTTTQDGFECREGTVLILRSSDGTFLTGEVFFSQEEYIVGGGQGHVYWNWSSTPMVKMTVFGVSMNARLSEFTIIAFGKVSQATLATKKSKTK